MDSLFFAPLDPAQVGAAVALDRRCLGGLWSQDHYAQELRNPQSTVLACLAGTSEAVGLTSDNALLGLGCSWGVGEETHITMLAVAPEVRGRGLGTLLVWGLVVWGIKQGRAWATLEVAADNQAGLGLYEKLGFKLAGRRPRYYASGADALILWWKLERPTVSWSMLQTRLTQAQWQLDCAAPLAAWFRNF